MTTGLGVMIAPIPHGWAVYLTNGRELARYFGLGARWRAMRRAQRAAREGG
jgi:hypothetical protein